MSLVFSDNANFKLCFNDLIPSESATAYWDMQMQDTFCSSKSESNKVKCYLNIQGILSLKHLHVCNWTDEAYHA